MSSANDVTTRTPTWPQQNYQTAASSDSSFWNVAIDLLTPRGTTQTVGRSSGGTRHRGMPLSIQRRVPLSRPPLSGQFRQPSPRTRSTSPAALAIDNDRSSVNKTVIINNGFVGSMRTSTHSFPWPASVGSRPRDLGNMIREDDSSTRQKEMSLSSTVIEETEPIDIPSQDDERSRRDSSSPFADQVVSELGKGTGQGTGALGSCWSAAWYSSEPWNRTTEYPEKAPAHIMIWEKRALRSACVAAEESRRRRSGGVLEGAPSYEGASSEDINIFELDM